MRRRRIWAIGAAIAVILAGAAMRDVKEPRGVDWTLRLALAPLTLEMIVTSEKTDVVLRI